MKSNVTAREEVRRFPDRYIASVKTPDGRLLRSSREMRDAFRAHFRDRFARCPDLPIREFRSYLADFSRLGVAEAASCEGVVTECEVRDALEQVGLIKSPGLDGLPYEVYLRISQMFVPILTDMFNHWFAQGVIPGCVTKGVITLLKKGGQHVGEGLDDYRPITLLNAELKILVQVLANRLQRVISDLIGPEQTFAVKGRSIQDNLHLIREVLKGIEDDSEAALISLDQSQTFDRVDHRFLAAFLETAGFKPEFRRWISMMYDNPQAVVEVNRRRSEVFAIKRSVRQGYPLSPLLALEPPLRRLRDEGTSPSLRGVPFAGPLTARVSAFANDITVFVSRCLDIKAVKEAVVEYERIVGAKVNFDKSEGLRLGAWRGSNTLPGPFRWSDGPVRILGVWFGPDLQLERNWSEVQTKVGIWLSRHVGWHCNNPSPDCSGEVQGRWSVGRSVSNVHATGVWVCLIWRATGLLKDLHTLAGPWLGTQCGDERRVGLFLASSQTQRLKVDVSLWAKHCLSASAERPFVTFLGPVTFYDLGKSYIGS